MIYCFFLGRIHDLSQAELKAVLSRFGEFELKLVTDQVVLVESETALDIPLLMKILGGTVKIGEVIARLENPTAETILPTVTKHLLAVTEPKKLVFSLGSVNVEKSLLPDENEVKDQLKAQGRNSRYLETKHGLGAAQLSHHSIVELLLLTYEDVFLLARTRAVQDIDDWSKRDFGKPYRDPKKGMLPPKLARMMVNLAVGSRNPEELKMLDPFCGTGTVLMEAAMVGFTNLIGTDIDKKAIHGTSENIHWFEQTYEKKLSMTLSAEDVMQLTPKEKVDCIVSEPFLGKPNITEREAPNVLRGLEKLYLGMLKVFVRMLKTGGRVVIVFPVYAFSDRVKTLNAVIDRLESLGYTRENDSFRYSRPQTIVQRDIVILRRT